MHLGSSHFFCETEDVYLDARFRGCPSDTGEASDKFVSDRGEQKDRV